MIDIRDIQAARDRLKGSIPVSPCPRSVTLGEICGCDMHVKLENLQMTGSFKERGALNKLLCLGDEARRKGVIAASAGNHALGLSYHAQRLKVPAIVVMPVSAPLIKVAFTRRYGAEVVLQGQNYDEACAVARKMAEKRGCLFIHPFDDEDVIAGQGTLALEILDQVKDVEAILVPVGGGGLISGMALAVKTQRPSCRIIGVQSARMASMARALDTGRARPIRSCRTLADGIAVRKPGGHTFDLVSRFVDQIVVVEEDELAHAVLLLLEVEKTLAEGAGAAALAGAIYRKCRIKGERVVCVVSGGNMDVNLLSRIIDQGLAKDGRLACLSVVLQDTPGALGALANLLGELSVNIMEIRHEREFAGVDLSHAVVHVKIETQGLSHLKKVRAALKKAGVEILTS